MSAPPPLIALPSALVLTSTLLSTLSLSQVPRWHPALEIVDLGLKDLAPAHRWRDLDRRQGRCASQVRISSPICLHLGS